MWKRQTYLHQNPGIPEQYGNTAHMTENLADHEVGALLSLLPTKALWPSVPTPKVKHGGCTGS